MKHERTVPVGNLMIKKILVALDGSKFSFKALSNAIYLARQCGGTITGLYVVSVYPRNLGDLVGPIRARLYGDAKKIMEKAKITCAQNGIVFKGKVVYGDAKSEIPDFAINYKFDLVVMGSRGLSPVKELLLGSVTNAVAHKSKVPLLVVK